MVYNNKTDQPKNGKERKEEKKQHFIQSRQRVCVCLLNSSAEISRSHKNRMNAR